MAATRNPKHTPAARPAAPGGTGQGLTNEARPHLVTTAAPKNFWSLLRATYDEWSSDKAPRMGAALAYYTIFSLAPLLVVAISVAGLVFGKQAAEGAVVDQVQGMIGRDSALVIQDMIASAHRPAASSIASIVGIVILLFGASGAFGELQDSLNTIWEVKPDPKGAVWEFVKQRFLSFTMVLGIGFLLLVSLLISAAIAAVEKFWENLLPIPAVALHAMEFLISLAIITLLFGMIFKILPRAQIAWGDVWRGALMTAVLFTIGKFLIGLYLGKSVSISAYGAAGALIVVVAWVYYSAQILYFGAEFTKVYASARGSRTEPKEGASIAPKPKNGSRV